MKGSPAPRTVWHDIGKPINLFSHSLARQSYEGFPGGCWQGFAAESDAVRFIEEWIDEYCAMLAGHARSQLTAGLRPSPSVSGSFQGVLSLRPPEREDLSAMLGGMSVH